MTFQRVQGVSVEAHLIEARCCSWKSVYSPRQDAQNQVQHEERSDDDEWNKVEPVPRVPWGIVGLQPYTHTHTHTQTVIFSSESPKPCSKQIQSWNKHSRRSAISFIQVRRFFQYFSVDSDRPSNWTELNFRGQFSTSTSLQVTWGYGGWG